MTKKGLLTVAMVLSLSCLASATTWDVSADFSITNGNPNGAWSYGYIPTGATNFVSYTSVDSGTMTSTYEQWTDTNDVWMGFVLKNTGSTPMTDWGYYEPGQIILHPGATGGAQNAIATVRWTAPSAMTINVNALFSGQAVADGASTTSIILKNSTDYLSNGAIIGFYGSAAAGYTDRFGASPYNAYNQNIVVQAGDTLDFAVIYIVGNVPDTYFNDSTGLALTITEVPEPATISLIVAGFGMLLRKKRN